MADCRQHIAAGMTEGTCRIDWIFQVRLCSDISSSCSAVLCAETDCIDVIYCHFKHTALLPLMALYSTM